MAYQIGSMYASLTLDVGPYAASMTRAASITEQGANRIARSSGVAQESVNRFSGSMHSSNFRPYSMIAVSRAFENAADRAGLLRGSMLALAGVFGGFTAALSTNLILRYADNFAKLNNLVRVVSDGQADLAFRFNAVFEAANRSRSSLEATALLYSRIQKASPHRSAEEILRYTETIQKALTLGGASVQEARSAAIQFSQGIASNRLGGEELRAILETPLGLELARGLGVTIGKFREMGHAGQLTADVVLGALAKIGPSIDQQFNQATVTLDQSLTILDNKLTKYIGEVNRAYGATGLLGSAIRGIGDNLDTIMPSIAAVGFALAAAFGGRLLSGAGGRITAGWRERTQQLTEQANALRDEYNTLQQKVLDAELKQSILATRVSGDTDRFADKAKLDAYARAQKDIQGLDTKSLAIRQQIAAETKNLANISASASPRLLQMAQQLVDAETRLADAKARQLQIGKQLNTRFAGESSAQYQKRTAALMTESNTLLKQMGRDEQIIASRRVALNNLQMESDRQMAATRAESLRRIADLNRQLSDNNLSRGVAVLDARDARRGVAISGADNARRALLDQTTAARMYGTQLAALSGELSNVERAVSRNVGVMGFMRNAWGGFIGALGGPWGAAITGGIILLSLLGAAAAKNAQRAAEAQRLIDAALKEKKDTGNRQAEISESNEKIKELKKNIEDIRGDRIGRVDSVVRSVAAGLTAISPVAALVLPMISKQFLEIENKLFDGKISADQFTKEIEKLGATSPLHQRLAQAILLQKDSLVAASIAAQKYRDDMENAALVSGRITPIAPFVAADEQIEKDRLEYLGDARREIEVLRLRARGREVEAAALKKYYQLIEKGKYVSLETITANEREREALEKRIRELRKGEKAAESFAQKLALLREASEGSFLGEIDRSVILQARQWKIAAGEIEKYIAAASTGNFAGVSKQMMQIRDAKLFEAAGREARSIVQEYGEWAQIAPMVAEKQAMLNIAVQQGAISADQAQVALGRYIATFGNYKWIDDTSRAFTDFIGDAVTGTKTWTQALEDLRKAIVKIALEELALRPIRDLLRNGISSFTGASGFNLISYGTSVVGGVAGTRADGGMAGEATRFRPIPAFAAGGMLGGRGSGRSDSNLIWASRGEFIVNAAATQRHRKLLEMINAGVGNIRFPAFAEGGIVMPAATTLTGGLGDASVAVGPPVEVHIHKVPADMSANATTSQVPGGGFRIDIELSKQVDKIQAANIRSGRSETNKAFEERYGADPTRGMG